MSLTEWRWRATLRWLHSTYPVEGLRVYRRKIPACEDSVGWCCQYDDGSYLIVVEKRDRLIHQVDTLFHEWAHALKWDNDEDHTDAWGMQYARIIRGYERWVNA